MSTEAKDKTSESRTTTEVNPEAAGATVRAQEPGQDDQKPDGDRIANDEPGLTNRRRQLARRA